MLPSAAAAILQDNQAKVSKSAQTDKPAIANQQSLNTALESQNSKRQPRLLLMRQQALTEHKAKFGQNDSSTLVIEGLIKQAQKLLKISPLSVADDKLLPASNNKHDYFSVGPYWWPNEQKKDGLPWINKDGQVNPTFRTKNADNKKFSRLVSAVETLSLAYFFTDQTQYSDKAISLLQTWFIDPETKMNPHLNFAQSIPGRVHGRGIGIIEFRHIVKLMDAMTLTQARQTYAFQYQMDEWLSIFLGWLIESENGQDEAKMRNNHGSYYDAIILAIATYLEFDELAGQIIKISEQRLLKQIASDGSQEHELKRTRPFHYSVFNILAFSQIARIAEHHQQSLWQFQDANSSQLDKAIMFMADNLDNTKYWPGTQEQRLATERLVASLLLHSFDVNDKHRKLITRLGKANPKVIRQLQVCALLFSRQVSFTDTHVGSDTDIDVKNNQDRLASNALKMNTPNKYSSCIY